MKTYCKMKDVSTQKLNHSDTMRELVKQQGSLSDRYFSITYMIIEGNVEDKSAALKIGETLISLLADVALSAVSQNAILAGSPSDATYVFGVMTASQERLVIYALNKGKKFTSDNIENIYVIPIKTIDRIKINWFLGCTIRIWFTHEQKQRMIKIGLTKKPLGIKGQKEEATKLVDYLKKLKKQIKAREGKPV